MMAERVLLTVLFFATFLFNEALFRAQVASIWPFPASQQNEVTFRLFQRGSTLDRPVLLGNVDNFSFNKIQSWKPTVLLVHGWRGHTSDKFSDAMVNEYLAHTDSNIIHLDWSGQGSKDNLYPNARGKVNNVASALTKFLDQLHSKGGVKLESLHILGHSLGAHIAGIAGYAVKSGKIGRITGLDPAGPLFYQEDTRGRLSTDSAKFVDVIHSSPNLLGVGWPLGHVDFYPNGPNMLQPGCGVDVLGRCSHRRGYNYYVESLTKPKAFLAVPCADWISFQRKQCDTSKVIPMGQATPTTARGIYFLATNSNSPFGTGKIWAN